MTMTSVAVGPASLGPPSAMLGSKRYLQQGTTSNSASPTPTKSYETLNKSKKSWSVRLGLSRQHHTSDETSGWSTISGSSALSRQMLYGEPWLYGTVRSSHSGLEPRGFLTPPPPPPPGAPILVVCSCPEFLSGTTRKLGNCRKCGGHRLAGIPLGGTCRISGSAARARPSLAGVLRPSTDDPYDVMRRSRLVEPRVRARSISPHRQSNQRDTRSQSVARNTKTERNINNGGVSRSEWFDTEVNYTDDFSRKPLVASSDDWLNENSTEDTKTVIGRVVRVAKKPRTWQESSGSALTRNNEVTRRNEEEVDISNTSSNGFDSRKSILECNVNPYLLVKKNIKDEDDLSDDLSDNALELEDVPSSSLFDPSKVKSIERLPNRNAVAAIGGQRIRVFNEPREMSDEEDIPITRIPIPKVSPKRPPRRPKETKIIIKSILKRGKSDGLRKNVLFNVNNVIFAPEKSDEVINIRRPSKISVNTCKEEEPEKPIIPEEQIKERPKFITIPNIKEPKRFNKIPIISSQSINEAKNVPESKNSQLIEKKIEKVIQRPEVPVRNKKPLDVTKKKEINTKNESLLAKDTKSAEALFDVRPEDETDLEIEIEELKDTLVSPDDEKLILKADDQTRRLNLTRSQSDRSIAKPEISAASVQYLDTMRLSLRRSTKEDVQDTCNKFSNQNDENVDIQNVNKMIIEENKLLIINSGEIAKETPAKLSELIEKEAEPPPRESEVKNCFVNNAVEQFKKMRPTSWSPPPGKPKSSSRERLSDPGPFNHNIMMSEKSKEQNNTSKVEQNSWNLSERNAVSINPSKADIIMTKPENNVCKITVSPKASFSVHRLQVGGNDPPRGARRTSILINGDQSLETETNLNDNKVTISVGGEDSICNPTVISVNSNTIPTIQSSTENRTLVILENYKSNIILESNREGMPSNDVEKQNNLCKKDPKKPQITFNDEKKKLTTDLNTNQECYLKEEKQSRWSTLSKESLISKLLEDSLRKARENGEILDESSGEAILRILKQSLLKSKEYESSESTLEPEPSFSRSSSMNSDVDFVSTNLFLEENPYEVIKEPIYEEIPDEPPPLPLSPPPTEDYIKGRIYFPEDYKESYYKKVNSGQYLGSYLSEDVFKKANLEDLNDSYLSKSPDTFFQKPPSSSDGNLSKKFELLNFLMDSKDIPVPIEEDEVQDDDEEDTEGDLEALYEQKETSIGDLSSKSSQISNVSDSSEECNIILTNSTETSKTRAVDIERTDSGVGSESSQASSSRGVVRRWRTGNASFSSSSGPGSLLSGIPQVISGDAKLCEDCEQHLEPLITDSGVVYAPFVCRKCSKKRAERKEIITEIVETEQKYGRDLRIILEEFHRPMLRAGLLTPDQLSAIFLNVEELLEHNLVLAEKLKDAVELSQESGDEDLVTVDVGKIFLESERMLHAFESYCTRQGSASLLLQNLEKEKELLRIFLKVSQMENTVLRRMNLNSFLMVPVQRVTKYPLLLARLLKATPTGRPDVQEARKRLEQAQTNIELHLEHMNAEAKDVTSTKLWRRISIIQNGRRSNGEQDMVNIKLRKMAVEVLEWAHEEARFVLEGRLLVAQPTDNNWRRGRTVKLAPVTAMLVTNGKPNTEFVDSNDDSLFPRQIGIKEATLLLVKEKIGRYSLLREPLYLDKCIVCCETDLEDYFEIQELSSKETFIFKAEDGARTKRWCRTLQAHAQSLGAWRRRRGALPNIMICGVTRS
ncbi:uncharacterized protein RhoGEF64C [Chelonus insularis]|uniref:uncharacterized protein RhoGEF64C n=1 Tax=Chelonus insularis TaxID=460826 RepID=UPI00158EB383|nr:uncharacterized protein LOC118072109 [Chelonus insularis]